MTPESLSHLFSLMGESPIKTRCIDDRLSFKRARHRQKKKKAFPCWCFQSHRLPMLLHPLRHRGCLQDTGRFRGPSGRAPFSDEGGFTFSEAPFEGTLHEADKDFHHDLIILEPGRACSEEPVGRESQTRKVQIKETAPWTR